MPSSMGSIFAASATNRPVPLKVQLTISRYMGEKKLSSIPYVLGVLSNSQKTSIRMGIQVPVTQTVFAAKSPGGVADAPQRDSEPLALRSQRLGGTLALRDVAHDLRRADDIPGRVTNRRDREGNVEPAAVLRDAHGFEVVDALAATEGREDAGFLVPPIRRPKS